MKGFLTGILGKNRFKGRARYLQGAATFSADSKDEMKAVSFVLIGDVPSTSWREVSRLASKGAVSGTFSRHDSHLVQVIAEAPEVALRSFSASLTALAQEMGFRHVEMQEIKASGLNEFRRIKPGYDEEAGPLPAQIEPVVLRHSHAAVWNMLYRQARLSPRTTGELAKNLDLCFPRDMVPFNFDKQLPGDARTVGYSFAGSMWGRVRFREALEQIMGSAWEYVLEDKNQGRDMAQRLGLPLPELYQNAVPLIDVEPRPGVVVKPTNGAGSRGVFAFLQDGNVRDVRGKSVIDGTDAFFRLARETLDLGLVQEDSWNVEELVSGEGGGLPNDLKFYCFYGRCPLLLEVSRGDETSFCWWTKDGKVLDARRASAGHFVGNGAPQELWKMASEASCKIPTPFVRIDFLRGGARTVFGEFTPRTGGFSRFYLDTDRMLGQCFIEAEARLFRDLVEGKTSFDEFNSVRGMSEQ